ncbi:N-acetylneuraminate synthase family protein [Flavobacterium sp.]|uniref:N-acetylneuraminate synthase family protein n=1 Tax=Flavobacterium sp. TaxID=239 RepID=UPI002FDB4B17
MDKVKVDILISTKNRCNDLLFTLEKIKHLLNENVQCVIFDDGSADDTSQKVTTLFPEVVLQRNETSKGYLFCRNKMLNETKADFAISLDDDAHFLTENPIDLVTDYFSKNPTCGLIAARIFWSKATAEYIASNDIPQTVKSFVGCGHVWRMKAWREIPNYPEWFEFYGEENFASFQLFKHQWAIHYVPELLVQHRVDLKQRTQTHNDFAFRHRRSLRADWYNYFLFFPISKVPRKLAYSVWMQCKTKIFKGDFKVIKPLFLALFDLIAAVPKLIQFRKPLTAEEYDRFNKLNEAKIYWKPENSYFYFRINGFLMKTKPYLIAEIAQAHDGSLGILHSYIDAVAQTGVQAIKFQMHIAEAESSIHEPFRVKFSKEDATRYDYWKRMEFSLEQWKEIKKHCDEVGLDFICSPFSNLAVDWLEEVGVHTYKIGSGEVTNLLLLEKITQTGKPIIISSGMSNYAELDKTVAFLKSKNANFSILQCTTAYPTKPEQYGLNVIQELKERYRVSIGFSDHSAKIATGIAAVALGAEILEFHVVFHRAMFGPDAIASLTLEETKALVEAVSDIHLAQNHTIDKNSNESFQELKTIFEKSLAINKNLPKGHTITFDDLESKKPKGYGISATEFKSVIGKQLKNDKSQWDFLKEEDLA